MNSRLIYIANERMKYHLRWPRLNGSEWIYCGTANEVNKEIVSKNIDSHFTENELYVALTRNDSFESNKKTIIASIEYILGFKNFTIWDKSFTSVIEFNKIGVFRCGKAGK
jgi:hypothetical protein